MVNLHRGAFAASASAWAFTTGLICSLHIASNGVTLRITCKMQVTRKGNIAYVLLCCIIAAHSQHASHEPGPAIVCVHPPRSLVRAKFHARGPWRFAGVGFIALNLLGFLPGYFAWPAGLGDMAIGVTAPWVALALTRSPRLSTSEPFVAWNIFGIFDFAVLAVGMGAIAPLIFPRLLQTVTPQMMTAAPMRHLPLSMVPSFLVPMFTIFHLIALFQTRRAQVSRPM